MSWPGLPPGAAIEHLGALLGALLVALLATWMMRHIAPRLDFVSRPKGERWNMAPTPMGGGVALFFSLGPALWLLSPDLFVGALIVHLLGLVDDKKNLSPQVKLVGQAVAACFVVAGPLSADGGVLGGLLRAAAQGNVATLDELPAAARGLIPLGPLYVSVPLTIAFYVGVSNSMNLLDNMDGSAAGVTGVSAGFLYLLAVRGATPDAALGAAAASVVGAMAGFLVHNFPPAKIYMGDAGSLLLGFVLAGLAVRIPTASTVGPIQGLAVTVFVVGAPLFDTALVWITRRNARRPFLQGGRDHSTHRLMALGLSPRRTLVVIYGVAALLGGVAFAIARGGIGVGAIGAVSGGVVLVLLAVFLGEVPVYKTPEGQLAPQGFQWRPLLFAAELAVDVALLTAAWIAAHAMRFGDADLPFYLRAAALPALPLVLGAKVSALLAFGLYRGVWRTIGFKDVATIARAVTAGTLIVVVAATLGLRFANWSRGVIAIDWLLTLVAVVGSRAALRGFRDALERLVDHPRRAAVLGPDAARELLRPTLDPARWDLVATLAPGAPDAVVTAAREAKAEVVLLALPLDELDPVVTALRAASIDVRRLRVTID